MPTRPFFVMPDGTCVPLEGAWRVVELRGEWYVLGHNAVVPCGSQRAANSMLEELENQTDADRLAAEAIERFDALPTDSASSNSISSESSERPSGFPSEFASGASGTSGA